MAACHSKTDRASASQSRAATDTSAASVAAAPAATLAAPAAVTELPDPCSLLTTGEAQTILGEPVGDPRPSSLGGNKICDYRTLKIYGGISPYSVHIAITPESRQVWDAGKKLNESQLRAVPGLGEDAFFLLDDLEILTKARYVDINVLKNIDRPDHRKAIEAGELAVARAILPRM